MAPTRISVARVVELHVPITWQEAVEVARAADAAASGQGLDITLADCVLATDGTVRIMPDGADHSGPPLSALRLLAALLDDSAPAELRALLATKDESLRWALEAFASSEPAVPIAQLAERALAAEEADASTGTTTARIRRLRAEVRELEPASRVDRGGAGPASRPARRVLVAVGLVAVIALLGAAAAALAGYGPSAMAAGLVRMLGSMVTADAAGPAASEPSGNAAAGLGLDGRSARAPEPPGSVRWQGRAAAAAQLVAGSARSASPAPGPPAIEHAGALAGGAAASSTTAGGDAPERATSAAIANATSSARRSADAPRAERASRAGAAPSTPERRTRAPSTVALPPAVAAPDAAAPIAKRRAPARTAPDLRVYSDRDPDVAPPVMARPQLPSAPKPDSEVGDSFIEVMVDERGQVVQVRLYSSDLSHNDRMLVAAAKAWQFQPAVKDGRPVRYRLRVPVTQ